MIYQVRTFDGGIVGIERATNEWLVKYSSFVEVVDIKLPTTIWEENNGEQTNNILILYKTRPEHISQIEGNE